MMKIAQNLYYHHRRLQFLLIERKGIRLLVNQMASQKIQIVNQTTIE